MNDNYFRYKVDFSPIVWRQKINEDLADKLFIITNGKVPYFRTTYCYDKTHHGVFYKFKLPRLDTRVYNVVLNLVHYVIKYNERQIH